MKAYGWVPDLPDRRDKVFKVAAPIELPRQVDLRSGFPPCYDQGQLSSCTANAIAAAMQFDQIKQSWRTEQTPSRLFIYYNERVMENSVSEDAGAQIRDGIKAVNAQGAPPESFWPYDEAKFAAKPTDNAYAGAKPDLILVYERLDNTKIDNLKTCLASGFPFVFGFTVYDYFESADMADSANLQLPEAGETVQGGHAVVCCGYDDTKNAVIVRNSWGTQWGENGYFWMAYNYITDPDLADDFWCIKEVGDPNLM